MTGMHRQSYHIYSKFKLGTHVLDWLSIQVICNNFKSDIHVARLAVYISQPFVMDAQPVLPHE